MSAARLNYKIYKPSNRPRQLPFETACITCTLPRVHIHPPSYIPGPFNLSMVVDASRLLHLFKNDTSVYTQPVPWTGCDHSSKMTLLVIAALCKQRSNPESLPPAPKMAPIGGDCSWNSVSQTALTHGSPTTHSLIMNLQVFKIVSSFGASTYIFRMVEMKGFVSICLCLSFFYIHILV
jgi:hypothetical protein